MTLPCSLELFLDTRAAADIWIELHRTIRQLKETDPLYVGKEEIEPLTHQERTLYDALTKRFTEGLTQ